MAHLLLAGLLLGALLCLLLQRPGIQQFYFARAGIGLAILLLAWVGTLLIRQLKQRRWVRAGALAVLVVPDVALCTGGLLMVTSVGAPVEVYASPEEAQALTLDHLFWLRSKPFLDNEEYLVMERGWNFKKMETLNDEVI